MTLAVGVRLGPYEIVAPIGAGGMGEVWRARDTRLGRDVAVKVLPARWAEDPDRLRRFEQEARATAALNHPNILAIFDVGSHEGAPYLVEELLEGEPLARRIQAGDLTVGRSVALAVQVARGLSAAHERGIVHRDLKPDNLFVTRDGVVKILDFGLAKLVEPVALDGETVTDAPTASETGRVVGTPAYMAPEQARGKAVDHRADLFSLGVVLYEMLAGTRPFSGDSYGEVISAIVSRDPPPLPGSVPRAVQGVVTSCLEKRPEDRFSTARDVALALEAAAESTPARVMALRREEPRPYPGLASFTEADAERFFGREEEVAALWRKLPERSLLALIGPSGAGKTSFVRAGLVAHAPPRWRCLVATPGQAPFAGLARALVPFFAGDVDLTQQLIDVHRPEVGPALVARWAEGCDGALVVVDQAEELFTLNGEEVQARFAELLGRLAELPGVHVLLSLRDDFLFRCNAHLPLKPVFFDLTPLGPPTGDALRRALVEPAKRLGFAFEDETLVDEMLATVEGERGALPLLAFAVSRLWEERDREKKLLSREAYGRIGGVAGALAQHAEATLERLGEGSVPLVRELFRNLATGQQTRCMLEWEELLSVFSADQRVEAERVLAALVDARLLTSFELEGADGSWRHRVEVVHESLLRTWPRLVRWQAQDEEGALLRDQLRQAARLWEEKGKPDDLLWTGTSFQEYQVWRARYPGGLSAVEDAFGNAMVSLAGRRRRRRQIAVAAAVAVLAAGLVVVGSLWRRSVQETRRAEAEAAQREAAQLLALGRLKLADHPNAALAYAIASLERADNDPARRFAVEALWQGPPALFFSDPAVNPLSLDWSADGRWLSVGGSLGLALVDKVTGKRRHLSSNLELSAGFAADDRLLVTDSSVAGPTVLHVWALPEGRLEHTVTLAERTGFRISGDSLVTWQFEEGTPGERPATVRRVSLDGTVQEVLGRWQPHGLRGEDVDPSGTWLLSMQGDRLVQQRLEDLAAPGRVIGSHQGAGVVVGPWRDRAVTADSRGELRIWDVPAARLERTLKSPGYGGSFGLDPRGRFLAASATGLRQGSVALFDLGAPSSAEPLLLEGSESPYLNVILFSPDGSWLARVDAGTATLWRMAGPRSTLLGRLQPGVVTLAFTPDGDLLSTSTDGVLRRWLLSPAEGSGVRELWSRPGALLEYAPEVDRAGRFAVLSETFAGRLHVVPLDGSKASTREPKRLPGTELQCFARLGPNGKLMALFVGSAHPDANAIRTLDLATGAERTFDTHPEGSERCVEAGSQQEGMAFPLWLPDGRLVSYGDGGLRLWDLATGSSRRLRGCRKLSTVVPLLLATPDSTMVLGLDGAASPGDTSSLWVFDLAAGSTREVTSHGNRLSSLALDAGGTVLVTGGLDGVVRVGPLDGGEPHLLFGHPGPVTSVAVSPDGRRIASGSDDGTIRLWPMPDLSRPPLHTLPHGELLAKLRSLTNLRAVRDPSSDSGWKVEVGPFPGWAKVPEWQP